MIHFTVYTFFNFSENPQIPKKYLKGSKVPI